VASPSGDHRQSAEDAAEQNRLRASGDIPAHIAVIMDGNGRWAEERGKPRVFGHRAGVESVRDVTECCAELGVGYLTLYTFSTENWRRPRREVDALMQLLVHTTRQEIRTLLENGIRLIATGDLESLPSAPRRELEDAIRLSSDGDRMTLNLAISYSGRWEITRATRKIAARVQAGDVDAESVSEDMITAALCSRDLPDPDLLIRTGGEQRVSNFLLWQIAYSELYFTDCKWPDFRRQQVYEAVRSFQRRERRFGAVRTRRERPAGQ
jgi:undecaprenyl diphosphate synthase